MTKKSFLGSVRTWQWKGMFLILSGIIAEFTKVHVKRRLRRIIYDLAQFVGGDSQHAVPPAPSEHPLKRLLYNRAQS